MQLVQNEGGTQYNIICYATCADQALQANNWSWNAWVKVIQPTIV